MPRLPNLVPCLRLALLCALGAPALAAPTSPKQHFGFAIGDDYHLATYTQTEAYFRKLAAESDRVRLVEMGRTAEDRAQLMLVISAPENLKSLRAILKASPANRQVVLASATPSVETEVNAGPWPGSTTSRWSGSGNGPRFPNGSISS